MSCNLKKRHLFSFKTDALQLIDITYYFQVGHSI